MSTSQQNVSTITLNLRLNANPDRAVADVLSKINQVKWRAAARGATIPIVVKQTGQGFALMYLSFNSTVLTPRADHRLSDPRRAAAAADDRRRRQCADPRRPDLRDAHLARSRTAWRRAASRRPTSAPRWPPTTSSRPPARSRATTPRPASTRETSLDSAKAFAQLVDRLARRRADPPRRCRHDRTRPGIGRFVLGLRRPEGGVHRHLRDADRQPADGDRRASARPSRTSRRSCRRASTATIAYDSTEVHPRLDLGGRPRRWARPRSSSSW